MPFEGGKVSFKILPSRIPIDNARKGYVANSKCYNVHDFKFSSHSLILTFAASQSVGTLAASAQAT